MIQENAADEIVAIKLSQNASFFGYRSDLVGFEIKRMEDLLDPRLKGKVVIRDAVAGLNNVVVNYALLSAATSETWSRAGTSPRSSPAPATSVEWRNRKSSSSTLSRAAKAPWASGASLPGEPSPRTSP
jgi:hypothetical protein